MLPVCAVGDATVGRSSESEEWANVLLLSCCYQEISPAAARHWGNAAVVSLCDNLFSSPKESSHAGDPMSRKIGEDVISQAELRKGATLTTGTSAAIRLICELYTQALERRLADGALIEPGPLSFDSLVGVVC